MGRRRVACIIIITLSMAGISGCSPKPKKPYDIKFETEEIDFGRVEAGEILKFNFKFKNLGTETIEIKVVRPTCGCIAPGDWDHTVEPGKTGIIPVTYATEVFEGDVAKVTFIDTNVPGRESIALVLKGNIYNPVQIYPTTTMLGKVLDETKPLHGSFTIKYNLDTPLKINKIIPPNEQTRYNLVVVEEGKKYRLDIEVYPPFKRYEIIYEDIILEVGGKVNKEYKLTYSYLLPPPVEVNPKEIRLDMEKIKREPIERRININSHINDPIEVIDLQLTGLDIEYFVDELRKDIYYQIPLRFPLNFTFPGGAEPVISFRVKNDPRGLLYSIPIGPETDK